MLLLDVAKRLKATDYYEVPIVDLVQVLRDGFEALANLLIEEGPGAIIQIPKFGNFSVKLYKGHVCRHPRYNHMVRVPNRNKIRFTMSPVLYVKLNPNDKRLRDRKPYLKVP